VQNTEKSAENMPDEVKRVAEEPENIANDAWGFGVEAYHLLS
jgi:hypothetical protein